jgi:hypothetical protein
MKRLQVKLKEIKEWLRKHLHQPVHQVGERLRRVIRGHFNYYGVPRNGPALCSFRHAVGWLWWRALRRRSQKHVHTSKLKRRFRGWLKLYLPLARIMHLYPEQRLVMTQGKSPVR